ncbi:MAG: hypothetical protein JRG73_02215 [Deltaproteobacteria bacterium]|nr:hypothetical protein [Deltaproteobacteria bacterium]MBW2305724.1 hypothetical protein [Deltaproteobacteria bacterium]
MKLLHIYKSKPDDTVLKLAEALAESAEENHEVRLYQGAANYRQLLELIFQYDRVICWW